MKELRRKGEYRICMEGSDFTMYKGDKLLITSISQQDINDNIWLG